MVPRGAVRGDVFVCVDRLAQLRPLNAAQSSFYRSIVASAPISGRRSATVPANAFITAGPAAMPDAVQGTGGTGSRARATGGRRGGNGGICAALYASEGSCGAGSGACAKQGRRKGKKGASERSQRGVEGGSREPQRRRARGGPRRTSTRALATSGLRYLYARSQQPFRCRGRRLVQYLWRLWEAGRAALHSTRRRHRSRARRRRSSVRRLVHGVDARALALAHARW